MKLKNERVEHVAPLAHTHDEQLQALTTTHSSAQHASKAETEDLKSSLREIAYDIKHALHLLHQSAQTLTTENSSLRKQNHTLSAQFLRA